MYDDATRAKARTIAEARGLTAAATVTGIGLATLKRWAKAESWRKPNQVSPAGTPVAGSAAPTENTDAARSAHSQPFRDPARELAEDADLARRVFRQQAEALLDGHGRPAWVKDSAIAHAIMLDKRHAYGAPAGGWQRGREFTWAAYFAEQDQRMARLEHLIELAEGREGNGDG